jgi:hypothetical protein
VRLRPGRLAVVVKLLKKLIATVLPDRTLELVRRNHAECIAELQQLPIVGSAIVAGIPLVDGVATNVPHKLGRAPIYVRESCVRGAVTTGRIEEVRSGSSDRDQVVVLKATGWGATVTVDVLVL